MAAGALRAGLEALSSRVLEAAGEQEFWGERVRAGVVALLVFLDEDPLWARVFVTEAQLGGALTEELVGRVCEALPEVLEQSRRGLVVGSQVRPSASLIAELVVLGVASLLGSRMMRSERGSLLELERSLMFYVVEPYLARGAVEADRGGEPAWGRYGGLIVEQVPFRPHPRILLMLQAIASQPQMASGEVAQMVRDQENRHDVADLFKPLQLRGLIEDLNASKAVGSTRAWVLTAYGQRILEVITGTHAQRVMPRDRALSPAGKGSAFSRNGEVDLAATASAVGGSSSGEPDSRGGSSLTGSASDRGSSLREGCADTRPAARREDVSAGRLLANHKE